MKKIIVWSLFDSGNGSYSKVASTFDFIENFSIGIDRENKNDHFINLDLSDISRLWGKKQDNLFNKLDELPKPDIILASPPCESWSNASAMNNGNACWKQEKENLSKFTIRNYDDYKKYQFKPERQILTRLNGEMTIINTIEIIKRYKPRVYVIENPAYGRIWRYIEEILGFNITHENLTYYNNYNYPIKKPTKFGSNINLDLKKNKVSNEKKFNELGWSYNQRSNIPDSLVKDIFKKIIKEVI